jgi:hypothetical protein
LAQPEKIAEGSAAALLQARFVDPLVRTGHDAFQIKEHTLHVRVLLQNRAHREPVPAAHINDGIEWRRTNKTPAHAKAY